MDFRILGPVAVREGDAGPIPLAPKVRHLLGALLVRAGREWAADELLVELWGHDVSPSQVNSLRVHLSHLRAALRVGDLTRVSRGSSSYCLIVQPGEVDAARYLELGELARQQTGRPGEALATLLRADDLWAGPPLAGLDSPEINTYREHLSRRRLALVTEAAALAAAEGAPFAVARIGHWATEFPTSEPVALALAEAIWREGDSVEALRSIRGFRSRMAQEFGLDCSPAVGDVEHRILSGDSRPGDSMSGESGRASRPDVRMPRPPYASARTTRSHLVERIHGNLRPGAVVLVAGAPGFGRTTTVRSLADRFGRSAVLVPSPENASPHWLARSVLGAVPRVPATGSDPGLAVARHVHARLERAGTWVLVIDDVDRLDADSARVLSALQAGAAGRRLAIVASAASDSDLVRRSGLPDPTEVIRLGALGPDDIKLGVRAFGFTGTEAELDSVAQMVAEISGGHPTLVSTLMRAVVQNGVDSAIGGGLATADLTWFVERILTDLEPAARAVAQYAAIDGTLDLPVLATVVGETVETTTGLLERLVRAGLVTQSASGGAGLPPTVATAVRTLAGPITVQMLHADLAAAYRASEHRPPGKVVEHLRGAGTLIPRVELGRWIGRLGSAALRARAPLTAREHFAEALELFGDDVPSESLPWRLESVRASYLAGRFDEGARAADRAAAVALTLMDREAFVDAAVLSATPAVPDGSTRRTAVALLDTAATWVEPGDGRRIEVLEALLRSMVFTTATNELAKADAAARELASLDPSTSEGEALAALGLRHHDIARPVAARQRFLLSQRAVVAARASGRPELVLTCLRALAADAVQRTDADPVRTLHTYTVTAAAIGDAYHEWLSWALRGAWHEWAGEASAAMEALAAADGLAPYVDPEAVSMAALARGLSAAWREGDLAALAVGLGRAETDGLAVPTLADAVDAPIPGAMLGVAREAVAARQGRPVDLDAVEVGLDHSPIGAVGLPASALAARAIGGTASATAARLRGRITPLLHPHLEDLVVIDGGLGILGRVTQVAALAETDGHCPVH